MKEAEEAAKKNVPSKEERGVKTDDSKEMSEADCRELWKLIKEMDREFREMKQIADEWLMVNGRKDGCLGAVLAAMLLPAGAIYGIWLLFKGNRSYILCFLHFLCYYNQSKGCFGR